jgi:hypothetical protein
MRVVLYGENHAVRELMLQAVRRLLPPPTEVAICAHVLDAVRLLDEQPPPALVVVAEDTGAGLEPEDDGPERLLHDHVLIAARRRGVASVMLGRWQISGTCYGAAVVHDWGADHREHTLRQLAGACRDALLSATATG